MPLPKPPTTKAALLSSADLDIQAAPRADKRGGKSRVEPVVPASLDLFDGTHAQAPARSSGSGSPQARGSAGLPTKQPSLARTPAATAAAAPFADPSTGTSHHSCTPLTFPLLGLSAQKRRDRRRFVLRARQRLVTQR